LFLLAFGSLPFLIRSSYSCEWSVLPPCTAFLPLISFLSKTLTIEFTALLTFAKQKPISYCLLVPLKVPLGSSQRALYNGILRIADEPFYEEYKDILGEAKDEDVVRAMFEEKAGGGR
jgi:hypothetical protein